MKRIAAIIFLCFFVVTNAYGSDSEEIINKMMKTEFSKVLSMTKIEFKTKVRTNLKNWSLYKYLIVGNGSIKEPLILFYNKKEDILILGAVIDKGVLVKPVENISLGPEIKNTTQEIVKTYRKTYREVINPDGKKTLYLFYDPDCPFCKNLDKKLKEYKGSYRIVRKWFPLPIHPEAKEKSINIQISILEKHGIKENLRKLAEKIVNEDIEDGKRTGTDGTPMLVTESGKILPTVPDLE